jgi:hypothetical protein
MEIITQINNQPLKNNIELLSQFYSHPYQKIDDLYKKICSCIDKSSLFVYSGSWRFESSSSVFVEPSYYKNLNLMFHQSTKFNDNFKLILRASKNYKQTVFFDSILTRYKTAEEILSFLEPFTNVLAIIHIDYIKFNRLSTSYGTLCKILKGYKIDNFIVIEKNEYNICRLS